MLFAIKDFASYYQIFNSGLYSYMVAYYTIDKSMRLE